MFVVFQNYESSSIFLYFFQLFDFILFSTISSKSVKQRGILLIVNGGNFVSLQWKKILVYEKDNFNTYGYGHNN